MIIDSSLPNYRSQTQFTPVSDEFMVCLFVRDSQLLTFYLITDLRPALPVIWQAQ